VMIKMMHTCTTTIQHSSDVKIKPTHAISKLIEYITIIAIYCRGQCLSLSSTAIYLDQYTPSS
jgi:hypothetical protein